MGSIAAGVLTQNYHPNYSFLASSVPALSLVIVSYTLTPKIEKDETAEEVEHRGFYIELK